MVKFAGYLKRLKNLSDFVGKGVAWLNTNIVKPLKPLIKEGIDMAGYGQYTNLIDTASDVVDNYARNKNLKISPSFGRYVSDGLNLAMETQRTPSERAKPKYSKLF